MCIRDSIYSMLRAAGKEACLIGNMGYPVFDNIEDCAGAIAVIEMSSHQIEFTSRSPHIACLLYTSFELRNLTLCSDTRRCGCQR